LKPTINTATPSAIPMVEMTEMSETIPPRRRPRLKRKPINNDKEKDLRQAQEILDTDHYGLERVKDRILEYLAVQSRVNKIKGPIL
ncbi:hypothetical protein MJL81_30915, partial [Salmonella enterica subsp. enterica serovar Anatum]|nr:hypothetical protein [Salmonella enterica subsp. enterica serovar Anatum]